MHTHNDKPVSGQFTAHYAGNIRKMKVSAHMHQPARYQLPIGEQLIDMNTLLGREISLSYAGDIHCVHCGNKTKSSFNQGYCYRCMTTLAQCDTCIMRPELCHYDQGTCREPAWGEANCMQDHFVYLANTGTIKVGITRHVSDGISSRWLDQGATQALAIMRVQSRLISGLVESALKSHIADKTNWRTMLTSHPQEADLVSLQASLLTKIDEELSAITDEYGFAAINILSNQAVNIHYPVTAYPKKVKSINLDKEGGFSGELQGIKGQYLLLDGDRVINLRKYAGYALRISHT
ncbi:MAG: DUF2797 domain-containing protein [Paraglaciecola sp.]|nr:DUF2797 domain-containing protein [Paraglaciecola sp.]NCT48596.1 DUF2797 domain-containing protein [Paraglaciecola sp.]